MEKNTSEIILEKVITIDNTVTNVVNRLSSVENKISNIESKVGDIESKVGDIESKVGDIEIEQKKQGRDIIEIKEMVEENSRTIKYLGEKVFDGLEKRIETLERITRSE